ncbi:MAG: DNA cytosine methyltransferase [Gammaproteobacteria bacterium]|nr:DNA cytosine methyltransferase [Gammaproteobacteria bacterium]
MPADVADHPRVLSLFSGGSGLDLAIELALPEARTVCFVEGDVQAARVLATRMEAGDLAPAPVWSDVRDFAGIPWRGRVDLIAGGFPCQDISLAGSGAGIDGSRSGLWGEFARIIREVGPRLVFVENVAALTSRGLDRVLGDLASLGFDAEWTTLSAGACGAPHRRDRIFILAYRRGDRLEGIFEKGAAEGAALGGGRAEVADAPELGRGEGRLERGPDAPELGGCDLSLWPPGPGDPAWRDGSYSGPQPALRRDADGMAGRVDRLRILGNGVVPIQGAVALLSLLDRLMS